MDALYNNIDWLVIVLYYDVLITVMYLSQEIRMLVHRPVLTLRICNVPLTKKGFTRLVNVHDTHFAQLQIST